jgi:4-aminobutyrate aminotransferase-like enzyme
MIGVECDGSERALAGCASALQRGVIVLASGDASQVVSLTPPLSIDSGILGLAIDVVAEALA